MIDDMMSTYIPTYLTTGYNLNYVYCVKRYQCDVVDKSLELKPVFLLVSYRLSLFILYICWVCMHVRHDAIHCGHPLLRLSGKLYRARRGPGFALKGMKRET